MRGLSANALALKLRVPAIVSLKSSVASAPFPQRLRYASDTRFGTGAAFWMNLQNNYDLARAEQQLGARINQEVEAA